MYVSLVRIYSFQLLFQPTFSYPKWMVPTRRQVRVVRWYRRGVYRYRCRYCVIEDDNKRCRKHTLRNVRESGCSYVYYGRCFARCRPALLIAGDTKPKVSPAGNSRWVITPLNPTSPVGWPSSGRSPPGSADTLVVHPKNKSVGQCHYTATIESPPTTTKWCNLLDHFYVFIMLFDMMV